MLANAHALRRELTPQEDRVVRLVAEAKTNRQIAEIMGLSEDTVKAHLHRVFQSWEVSSRIELIAAAVQDGHVPCPNCRHTPSAARLLQAASSLRQLASDLEASATGRSVHGGEGHA